MSKNQRGMRYRQKAFYYNMAAQRDIERRLGFIGNVANQSLPSRKTHPASGTPSVFRPLISQLERQDQLNTEHRTPQSADTTVCRANPWRP
jgi:hypothetical protein